MAETSASVRRAFEAVGIRPEQRRSERLARLTGAERELYRWILQTFAAGRSPDVEELCDMASGLDAEVEEALTKFAHEDLVHHDPATGEILVAYQFSGRATPHRVRLGVDREVDAMCAIARHVNLPHARRRQDRHPLLRADLYRGAVCTAEEPRILIDASVHELAHAPPTPRCRPVR